MPHRLGSASPRQLQDQTHELRVLPFQFLRPISLIRFWAAEFPSSAQVSLLSDFRLLAGLRCGFPVRVFLSICRGSVNGSAANIRTKTADCLGEL